MLLQNFENAAASANGGQFSITSTSGAVSTYQLSQSSASVQTLTSASLTTESSVSSTSTSSVSSLSLGAVSTSAAPATSPASGIGKGAKAGIGIGAAIGALVILAGLAYLFLLGRRKRWTDDGRHGAPFGHQTPNKADHSRSPARAYRDAAPEATQSNVRHELGAEKVTEEVIYELGSQRE
jgi:hypothetical protein